MSWKHTITSVLLLASLAFLATGCEKETAPPTVAVDHLKAINIQTETISGALQAMLTQEQMFAQANREPKHADLFTYWTAFTSTTLDMRRLERTLVENPDIQLKARNMWIGRIQGKLVKMKEAGMFTDMKGPITSRLGAAFGEERIQNEAKKFLDLSNSIEKTLDIQEPNQQ